jgi:hypothetical protein
MPTIVRHLDAGAARGFDAIEALVVPDFDFDSVNDDFSHDSFAVVA